MSDESERKRRKSQFAKILEEKKISASDAAKLLGLSDKTISRYLDPNNENAPRQAYLDILSNVDVSESESEVTRGVSEPDGDDGQPQPGRLVEIPLLVDISAAAHGPNGGFLVDTEFAELEPSGVFLPDSYIRQVYGVSPDRVWYIHGRGDSMWPTISPGQRVMIALLPEGTQIRDGLIYIINYAGSPLGSVLVKRLRLLPDHVKVIADNPEVEDYLVPFEVWDRDYAVRAVVLETAVRH